jgi:hypothetical protein
MGGRLFSAKLFSYRLGVREGENVCLEIDTQRKLAFVHLAQNWGEIKANLNHLDANYCRHSGTAPPTPDHENKKTYFC